MRVKCYFIKERMGNCRRKAQRGYLIVSCEINEYELNIDFLSTNSTRKFVYPVLITPIKCIPCLLYQTLEIQSNFIQFRVRSIFGVFNK